jgi:hypothetical protein
MCARIGPDFVRIDPDFASLLPERKRQFGQPSGRRQCPRRLGYRRVERRARPRDARPAPHTHLLPSIAEVPLLFGID